jgi:hypothetical protein
MENARAAKENRGMIEIQVRVRSGSKDRDDTRHQHDSCPDEGVSHILHQRKRLYQRTVSMRYRKTTQTSASLTLQPEIMEATYAMKMIEARRSVIIAKF